MIGPHWQIPADILPDDDILVLVRKSDPDYPLELGIHADGDWWNEDAISGIDGVVGWMHLDDATRILDGGAS